MPPDGQLTPERIAELRRMTPEQKLKEMNRLYWEARRSKEAELRSQYPDWSEEEVYKEVGRIFLAEAMKEG